MKLVVKSHIVGTPVFPISQINSVKMNLFIQPDKQKLLRMSHKKKF